MCDTIVVVGHDRVLFAKNSDRDPNESQVLEWVPAADHPTGEMVRCTWIEIPQVDSTNAVLLSRPSWMWGAEIGSNEHGVTIGNEAVFTKEPYADIGLTGMDMIRLALERTATASAAVEVMVSLLETHGQGGGCGFEQPSFTYHNSFIVADRAEAYVLETAGTRWATEKVESGVRSISNGLTIPGFADEYSDWLKTTVSRCRVRREATGRLAAGAAGPSELMAVLRDHGDGRRTPNYSWLNGAMSAPCMHGGGVATGSQTTASWAADVTNGNHWATGTAAPCTSLFKPVSVTEPVAPMRDALHGVSPEASRWWIHERLHRRAMRNPERSFGLFAGERDDMEQVWLVDRPGSHEAFIDADRLEQRWIERMEAEEISERRPPVARIYWRKRDRAPEMMAATTV
jgi:dipeptidase